MSHILASLILLHKNITKLHNITKRTTVFEKLMLSETKNRSKCWGDSQQAEGGQMPGEDSVSWGHVGPFVASTPHPPKGSSLRSQSWKSRHPATFSSHFCLNDVCHQQKAEPTALACTHASSRRGLNYFYILTPKMTPMVTYEPRDGLDHANVFSMTHHMHEPVESPCWTQVICKGILQL